MNLIKPNELTGPRSYFTDIDHRREGAGNKSDLRKLKLQLLTKERVVVAASSMFSPGWASIFARYRDLEEGLECGALVPAVRDDLKSVDEIVHKYANGDMSSSFYRKSVGDVISWSANSNSDWFKNTITQSLSSNDSMLRNLLNLDERSANEMLDRLDEISLGSTISRQHLNAIAMEMDGNSGRVLSDYTSLIYRISGAIAVNSSGHFPQTDLASGLDLGADNKLNSEAIFWDIYVDAIITYIGTAVRLTPDRLDTLSFSDIYRLRTKFMSSGFNELYDKLIASAKTTPDLSNPERVIYDLSEMTNMARTLEHEFRLNVRTEIFNSDNRAREQSLWQMANAVALVSGAGAAGAALGVISTLLSIPEMTAPYSPNLASKMRTRLDDFREIINSKIGWSESQKRTLVTTYKDLVTYGLE